MKTSRLLQWGIIGAGHIAHEFADGVTGSATGELLAVASRSQQSSDEFGELHGVARRYQGYQALLDDADVQAVYIATPHPLHLEWAVKAAESGKHILVEKPIGLNVHEAMAMIDAARVHDVFLMEAFMYRCHPQIEGVVKLLHERAIGDLQLIRASFSYRGGDDPANRTLSQALAGGGILDVGCYPVSMSRLLAGATLGLPLAEPLELKGLAHLGATGVDEWAVASLRFPGDILAQLSTGIRLNQHEDNTVELFGSEGKLTIPDPWCPSRWNRDPARLLLKRHDEASCQEILVEAPHDLYSYEADMVGHHIHNRQAPAMNWDDTLGNMRVLDRWRAEVGLVYEMEKPSYAVPTIEHEPLQVRREAMKYGNIAGLEKRVSRLIMGCDSNNTMPETAILFDHYFEQGGTTFDTSHAYGNPNGACEINLGWWVRHRGIRDQVVIIEKGANFPNDNPEGLNRELQNGLERLQMDSVDLYLIHRDNEQVPIGEWVEALNENLAAGRMSAFGLSNFSLARLRAFQSYAEKKGLQSFAAVSNQFSLAQVLAPIWDMHLVSASDQEFRDWFELAQIPLLPWSSQARGFFTPRAAPDKVDDLELVRCWYSPENFARKQRAEELAAQRGVEPINIALAYVLCQPFPTFPLVGAKQFSEIRSCLRALEIAISPEELRWLDTGIAPG